MCIKYYLEDHQGTNENICSWEGEIVDCGNCRGKETVHLLFLFSLTFNLVECISVELSQLFPQ